MRFLYSISVYALMAVLLLYFLIRSLKEPAYRQRWQERLGLVDVDVSGGIWIHAASVGEVQAVTPLVDSILRQLPDRRVLLTTFTPTGSELVMRRAELRWPGRVQHCYLPLDTVGAVRRFLKRVSPAKCIIVETELWPNLLSGCQAQGVPVSLVSATLSETSLHRYQAFPANKIFPPALRAIDAVLAQTRVDAERFSQLGVPASKIQVVGNIKFDYMLPDGVSESARRLRAEWHAVDRPVWVAASTHEGEEQIVLDAFKRLSAQIDDLLLILVPRHTQRFERAAQLCHQARLSTARFSRSDHVDNETEVILGDTLGDLLKFMAIADVVFLGGSLVPVGGHNLLEPAALKKCVISGAHVESQAQLRDLLDERGAYLEVNGAEALATTVKTLLDSPSLREEKGRAAYSVLEENRGVVSRVMASISKE